MKITIDTNKKQIIIAVVIIVFLYLVFYTNYIIYHDHTTPTSTTTPPSSEKHVHFNTEKNQEIVYETDTGMINIDYTAPQMAEHQRISKCTYPMNNPQQINMRDCTIDKTCLNPLPDQGWFREQRSAKRDLPGFNGYNLANFSFAENNNEHDRMMRNMIYENLPPIMGPPVESFTHNSGRDDSDMMLYYNAQHTGAATPMDLCRSCAVGQCNGDICGNLVKNDFIYTDYNYH
jgi:hypothetical protein